MSTAWGARTDTGLVRRGNEDSYLVQEPIFVVADGMGGHLAGDVASSTAVEVITGHAADVDAANPETLTQVLKTANSAIYERAREDQSLQGMGTTCTLVMLDGDRAHLAHVGDSRAYLLRDGTLEQLTEDHTLVGRMVREGRITAEEAVRHPQRSVITRALGVDSEVDVDLSTVALHEGDRVLLCSDGLSSMISDDVIADVLTSAHDPQAAADRLVDLALEAGGEDNVTVVIIAVGKISSERDPQSHLATATGPAVGQGHSAPQGRPPPAPDATGAVAVSELSTWGGAATAPPARPAPPAAEGAENPPARRGRRLLLWLVGVAILAALLYGGARYALANSWYVGVNDDGYVAIYQGRPEEISGIALWDEHDVSLLHVEELPEYLHEDLEEGIKVASLDEARETVENLEGRVLTPRRN